MDEFEMEEQPEFNIPESLVNKLYELSGDSDKYKGLIIACISEKGNPIIYHRFDSVITELGLKKALFDFLERPGDPEMFDE
jgi:hypothetical protein